MPDALLAHDQQPALEQQRTQRRAVTILSLSTVLGGLGVGASVSAGALLVTEVTGQEALSGLGATMNAVGAAVAGIPLARLAMKRGRRFALVTGNFIAVLGALGVIAAAALGSGVLLFLGLAVLGVASAVQLQSRFAATDLAQPTRRARDLSLVVWAITIGAVSGPNLITPGEALGEWLGVPALAGVFVFPILAQLAAAFVVLFGLRPDPLLLARSLAAAPATQAAGGDTRVAGGSGAKASLRPAATPGPRAAQLLVIAVVALAHAVMVGVMAMTPVHIVHHGGSVALVGFTISLHIAGMYALSPVFGALASRLGALPVVVAGLVFLSLAAAGAGFGGASMGVVQLALISLGIGWSMVTVAASSLLTDLTPDAIKPRRQGQSDTTMNAAGALFGAASGAIFTLSGFPGLAAVAAVLLAAAFVCVILLRRLRAQPTTAPQAV